VVAELVQDLHHGPHHQQVVTGLGVGLGPVLAPENAPQAQLRRDPELVDEQALGRQQLRVPDPQAQQQGLMRLAHGL
jgi:hypothetical protein